MKAINTSYYDFETLITGGYVYVDKTALLYELAKPGTDGLYYLPRPRRFGKSLMISTLKALFQGRRELFKGLAIEKTDWNWEKEVYPVLHLDMSSARGLTVEKARAKLQEHMRHKAEDFGAPFNPELDPEDNFENLMRHLVKTSPSGKFVLLIDEYDAPISGMIDLECGVRNVELVRAMLHDFYIKAKICCGDIRFMMVTGVSKFAKTSIFSAFNNPKDLTLDARVADLLGYTHEEMETYFHEHIQAFADTNGLTYDSAFAELLRWYDGYQFAPMKLVKVVNPVSLGNALTNGCLGNYWEATAGSTLIFEALKAKNAAPVDLVKTLRIKRLDAADALEAPIEALLYQGGYLTIDRRVDSETVSLRIPNEEVRDSLYDGYMSWIFGRDFELDDFELTAARTFDDVKTEVVKP